MQVHNVTIILGKISANMLKFFLIFLKKQILTFHANYLQWRQLHEMSNPVFLGKIKENIINMSSAEIAHRVVQVNGNGYTLREATLSKLFCLPSKEM